MFPFTGLAMREIIAPLACTRFGYKGYITRTSVLNKAIAGMILEKSAMFLGTIPRSLLMKKIGLIDDLLVYGDYGLGDQVIRPTVKFAYVKFVYLYFYFIVSINPVKERKKLLHAVMYNRYSKTTHTT